MLLVNPEDYSLWNKLKNTSDLNNFSYFIDRVLSKLLIKNLAISPNSIECWKQKKWILRKKTNKLSTVLNKKSLYPKAATTKCDFVFYKRFNEELEIRNEYVIESGVLSNINITFQCVERYKRGYYSWSYLYELARYYPETVTLNNK